jgi:hypothetical protein
MLKRKLLTIACVAGILVCGACGLFIREPPPPMTLFVGVRTVRVAVTNKSTTHQIDLDAVRQAIIKELNSPFHQSHMLAVAEGDADCTLNLEILDEDARESIQDPKRDGALWNFKALISAKLERKDGRQLWTRTHWPFESTYGFYHLHGKTITNGWIEPGFRKEFDERVTSELVSVLVYK